MKQEIIAVQNLSKSFGKKVILRNLAFSITGPQVIGVLGPNGSGKTTLLETLAGLLAPSKGSIRLFETPLKKTSYPKQDVGVVLQKEFVMKQITVSEYADLFAAIYRVPDGCEKILVQANLVTQKKARLKTLSGGELQRLVIAAASVHHPRLLFLDEPTAHLDPEAKRNLGVWIRELSNSCTIWLNTHDLQEANRICDFLLFLVEGEIKAQGTKEELSRSVPEEKRVTQSIEDAFFYFCASRLSQKGELL